MERKKMEDIYQENISQNKADIDTVNIIQNNIKKRQH